jgi:predicted GH43/DUF377 family glycosyl hydrolase
MSELFIPGRVLRPTNPWGAGHFWLNAGLVEAWGKTWLLARVGRQSCMIFRLEMTPDGQFINPMPLFGLSGSDIVAEDPRVIFDGHKLIVYYVGLLGPGQCAIFRGEVDRDGKVLRRDQLHWRDQRPFGVNGLQVMRAAFGIGEQKNWIPFIQGGREYCIYHHAPWMILEWTGNGLRLAHKGPSLVWDYGEIRGGAPPIKIGNRWHSIFHSAQFESENGKETKVYYAGVLTFDDDFRVDRITAKPIMGGNVAAGNWPWSPPQGAAVAACFPCGAIRRNESLLVSYGWLDAEVRVAEIPVAEIESQLVDLEPTSFRPKIQDETMI